MLIALYLTVIYIILFTFLDGYTYIFADIHGTNDGITGLCFLGIIIGLCLATTLVPLIYHWAKQDLSKLRKKYEEEGRDPAEAKNPPEDRLWFAMMGEFSFFPFVILSALAECACAVQMQGTNAG